RHMQMTYYQNSGDLRLLRIIAHHQEGVMPSTLAHRLEVALPTVSRKLNILEKQELIERKSCEEDRRKTFIFATEKGIQLVEEYYRQFISGFGAVCEKLGDEKTAQLTQLLEEFSGYMDTVIHREEDKG
ncbi:MAG: MarR family transcriptional regulator, partial [Oscillospiraceae bacterium]|nr:MarR family transcriptional regulator [Oscillospiraceae bacterium]